MASTYCVRSLVPIEKKSACAASSGAMITAEGTSIMMPVSSRPAPNSCRTLSVIAWASRRSATVAIIGYMIFTGPCAAARKIARNWVRNRSG